MDIEIAPCSAEHLEKLIQGSDAFTSAYGLRVVDGYLPFDGALAYVLKELEGSKLWHPWLSYMFLARSEQALIGFGGFKSVPDAARAVEIGYSVAPSFQGRGVATTATCALMAIAFDSGLVDCVYAHTLAERNASTRVLEKAGMIKVSEAVDPDVGSVWRWEIGAS